MPEHAPALPPCPQCGLDHTYPDGDLFICPDCGLEWHRDSTGAASGTDQPSEEGRLVVRDAHGNLLQDGDTVLLVKDLKVKGAGAVLKKGTKIKAIRLVDGADGHNVDCKSDLGSLLLKSEFLKKA